MLLLLVMPGCTTVNETGRSQFNIMSPAEEMKLGLSSFNTLKQEVPISTDPAGNAMLQRVGKRISAVADMPDAQWEFVLFQSDEPNAFCLPGGKVGVYTGILPITKDEAGLAVVVGHEIAHATARHGGERVSQQMGLQTFGSLLGASLSSADPRVQALTTAAYGMGTQVGLSLPHSRTQESEADYIGLLYMARAGYDPQAAVAFWERFAAFNEQAGGSEGVWFLRTHPVNQTRIKQIQEWLPEVRKEYHPAP
jgi:predicted Zn-dependent protease